MKRIKTVNGYAIYQAATQKDADTYNCEIGNYNIYVAQDIRDYGLTNSYPEWENEDSLAVVLARCNGSNYAVAAALADELSDSTVQDMDLVQEIERRLDAGLSLEEVRNSYDVAEQSFDAEPGTCREWMWKYKSNLCGRDYLGGCSGCPADHIPGGTSRCSAACEHLWCGDCWNQPLPKDSALYIFRNPDDQKIAYPDGQVALLTWNELQDVALKAVDDYGITWFETCAEAASPEELDTYPTFEAIRDDAALADGPEGDLEDVLDAALAEQQPEPSRLPSHATYYVTVDYDGVYRTRTVDFPAGDEKLPIDREQRIFFRTVAKAIAFDDCYGERVDEIVFDGQPYEYVGWQRGMEIAFRNTLTGEIVFDECFPEWDH